MKKILTVFTIMVVTLCFVSVAFAADSPHPAPNPVEVTQPDGGTITHVKNPDGTITFEFSPKDGYKIDTWVFEGEYEIVEGTLTSTKITIKPKNTTDTIKAKAIVSLIVSPTPSYTMQPTPATPTPQQKSPVTGGLDSGGYIAILSGLGLLIVLGTFVVKKAKSRG